MASLPLLLLLVSMGGMCLAQVRFFPVPEHLAAAGAQYPDLVPAAGGHYGGHFVAPKYSHSHGSNHGTYHDHGTYGGDHGAHGSQGKHGSHYQGGGDGYGKKQYVDTGKKQYDAYGGGNKGHSASGHQSGGNQESYNFGDRGHSGAQAGGDTLKDRGHKQNGFKKTYTKEETGDNKEYFDIYRDKDYKKKHNDEVGYYDNNGSKYNKGNHGSDFVDHGKRGDNYNKHDRTHYDVAHGDNYQHGGKDYKNSDGYGHQAGNFKKSYQDGGQKKYHHAHGGGHYGGGHFGGHKGGFY